MKLQMASRLAVFAVLELASDPERQLSTGEIAEKYGVSPHHLAKVLHSLVRAGLVQSVRGAGGGYRFAGRETRATLMDVVGLFEPIGAPASAARESGDDTEAGVALARVLAEIDEVARATLNSITIATMLKLMRRKDTAAVAD